MKSFLVAHINNHTTLGTGRQIIGDTEMRPCFQKIHTDIFRDHLNMNKN